MEMTKKAYNHILVIVDSFSKFLWLYPTKSTDTKTVIDSMEKQSAIFGNPVRVVTDRGTAFTSQVFEDYCKENRIHHLFIEEMGKSKECIEYLYQCYLNFVMTDRKISTIIFERFKWL